MMLSMTVAISASRSASSNFFSCSQKSFQPIIGALVLVEGIVNSWNLMGVAEVIAPVYVMNFRSVSPYVVTSIGEKPQVLRSEKTLVVVSLVNSRLAAELRAAVDEVIPIPRCTLAHHTRVELLGAQRAHMPPIDQKWGGGTRSSTRVW